MIRAARRRSSDALIGLIVIEETLPDRGAGRLSCRRGNRSSQASEFRRKWQPADRRHARADQGRWARNALRKQLPEPVFGQIKQARGFRQFLLRGLENVGQEWAMVCIAHNILKLAAGMRAAMA